MTEKRKNPWFPLPGKIFEALAFGLLGIFLVFFGAAQKDWLSIILGVLNLAVGFWDMAQTGYEVGLRFLGNSLMKNAHKIVIQEQKIEQLQNNIQQAQEEISSLSKGYRP